MADNKTIIPDLTKKVLGYRQFSVHEGQLSSLGINPGKYFWVPGPDRAQCLAGQDHEAPDKDCYCGFYGLHEIKPDWKTPSGLLNSYVVGAITGWGRMQIHSQGFRSEYCQVNLLTYDPHVGPKRVKKIHKIAKLYEIRAVPFEEFLIQSKEFGDTLPASLYPKEDKAEKISNSNLINQKKVYEVYLNKAKQKRWEEPPYGVARYNFGFGRWE